MRLRLTVALPPDRALHEVEVEAPEGTTARELGRALELHLACDGDLELGARGVPLADDAPLGSAPLVDGASVVLTPRTAVASTPAAHRAGHPPRPPVVLSVAHGPDAGRSHDLTPGIHRVGRSAEAEVIVGDDRLSRLHLEVRCDGDGVTVRDLHSTNGARLAGTAIGSTPLPWATGAALTIGHTELVLRAAVEVPASSLPRPDGTRLVNRQPRVLPAPASETVTLPRAPAPPSRPRMPWVAVLAPLPLALLVAVFLGPATLTFALMSPVLMGTNLVAERLHGSRRHATQQAEHERALAEVRARVAALCMDEQRSRRRAAPDPAEILSIATGPSARLWERRRNDPDALAVTVGTCTSTAGVQVVGPPDAVPVEAPTVKGVPCVVRLGAVGVLSLCGPRPAVLGTARVVLGQLLTLHSPVDLQLVVLSAARRAADWQWLSRVPHAEASESGARSAAGPAAGDLELDEALVLSLVDQLARTVAQRGNDRERGPHIVVLLDGAAALRTIPGMSTVLQHGAAVGITVLALDSVATALPSETGALLDLTDPDRPSLRMADHEHYQFVADAVGAWWADRLSRGLAPLRDATPPDYGALPSTVPLLSLVPGADDAQVVASLWREPPRASAPIGVTAQGPWVLDLAADGPHVLVAGTTGSGKSELLRTLVVSLAIHHRPEELSFVLVDYKGGAAFRECERLPHTAGVVTDLDEHLAHRALTSLRAELKRRERLFASVGATDFSSYQRHSSAESRLPRLVVVIDEFRALAEELPEFVAGIVSIAALGRSLGLHVVLATQRPAGVVTADIKANVNLRIALRVRDGIDSQDVLDVPDAAAVAVAVPGRGYARSGGSGLVGFQAARLSAPREPTGIRVRDLVWGRTQPPWPAAGGSGDAALKRIVATVVDAAALLGAAPAPPVWLPPLPLHVPLASLPSPSRPECCAIGLADHPELHAQVPLELDLAMPGHWAFVGAGSSGRTTALVTVARALASRLGADQLHVYAVSGGSLVGLTDLPQCGAHVDVVDLGRLERLVDRLEAEIRSRQRDVGPERARLLLVVDDWDVLAGGAGSLDHALLLGRLLGLLREGEAHGLTTVVAGDRSLLLGRVASVISRRVLLRLADRTDAALAGLAATALPADPPPGRGVLRDGTEVQLAVGPAGPAKRATVGPRSGPARLDPLPTRVVARDLPGPVSGGGLLVGLGGDTVEPLALHEENDGRRWLVTGGRGSGVSSALLLVAQGLVNAGRPVTVVAPRPGPLDALRHDRRLVGWSDARSLTAGDLARDCPSLAVVADSADELLDTRADDVLRDFGREVERQGGLLFVGASATTLMTQFRGVATEVARERTGILLGPRSALEGDLFGLGLRADPQAPPGRGYLIRRGRAVPLQVAEPGTPSQGG